MRLAFAVFMPLLAFPLGAAAQLPGGRQVTVTPIRDLSFGPLMAGSTGVVTVDQAGSRGELELDGNGTVSVQFVLPAAMQGPNGATIPLRFGYGDGAYVASSSSQPVRFDPRVPQTVKLPGGSASGRLMLGGKADVPAMPNSGLYSIGITVIVSNPNN